MGEHEFRRLGQRIAAELSGGGYSLFTRSEWESIADCMLRAAFRRLGAA